MTGKAGMAHPVDDDGMLDWHVVRDVAAGHVDAFEILLQRHSASVFGIVSRRIPAGDVQAVAQEAFVAAFRSLEKYEGRQPFENWIARIARRRCCDYWRERERRRDLSVDTNPETRCAWIEHAETELANRTFQNEIGRRKTMDVVSDSLARLDAGDRALIESIYFEDLPLKEVAATLGWSVVKTKVRAHRVRKRLRHMLENGLKDGRD